jgi:hypothetical protein
MKIFTFEQFTNESVNERDYFHPLMTGKGENLVLRKFLLKYYEANNLVGRYQQQLPGEYNIELRLKLLRLITKPDNKPNSLGLSGQDKINYNIEEEISNSKRLVGMYKTQAKNASKLENEARFYGATAEQMEIVKKAGLLTGEYAWDGFEFKPQATYYRQRNRFLQFAKEELTSDPDDLKALDKATVEYYKNFKKGIPLADAALIEYEDLMNSL